MTKQLSPIESQQIGNVEEMYDNILYKLMNITTSDDLLEELYENANQFDPWRIHVLRCKKNAEHNYDTFNTFRYCTLYFEPRDNISMILNIGPFNVRFNETVITSINHKPINLDINIVNEDDLFSLSTMYEHVDFIWRFKKYFLTLDSIRLKLNVLIRKRALDAASQIEKDTSQFFGKDVDLRNIV
ncbi:hypothetical protein XaC1_387 [Xanthomonas phage XaC1]|nr:hypothetical protein XaC1_387 [Xanthomonas phage XaC1]